MKRCLSILLTLALLLTFAACADVPATVEAPPAPEPEPTPVVEPPPLPEPFPGKIAIITFGPEGGEELYRSARQIVEKYGEDKISHVTWPANFMQEQEQMVKIVIKTAADPDVKALIINSAVPGTNAAVAKLRQTREDIFVVYCQPQEDPAAVTQLANLVMGVDEIGMGPDMARQAQKLGAKTFVHYSFPRHMNQPLLAARRDLIKEECARLGIDFVNATVPDPTSDVGVAGAQQFILDDVPKMVAKYGTDTAFFATNCSMQIPLIQAVVESGAIYPQSCHPSPYHGFPAALEIQAWSGDGLTPIDYIIDETARILGEKGALGRLSTWPVPVEFLQTNAGAEYAIKWINGEVPKEGIDVAALKQIMVDYAGVECFTSVYQEDDVEYPNYLLVMEDYITFGEEYIKTEASRPSTEVLAEWQGDFLIQDGVLLEYRGQAGNITIPASITSIEGWAFWNNETLRSVTLPQGLTSLGMYAFSGCGNLQSITIPNGITEIKDGSFYHCANLQSVIIPKGVTRIGRNAFMGCTNLKSAAIPHGVTVIESSAFSGCASLQSVTIPDGVTKIEWRAFSGCSGLKSVNIPDGVTEIGTGAFEYCSSLESVTIPEGVTKIDSSTFENCDSLKSVIIPYGVTSIEWRAFYGCNNLESITIPYGVVKIDDSAFQACPDLVIHCPPNSAAESYAKENNIPYVIE